MLIFKFRSYIVLSEVFHKKQIRILTTQGNLDLIQELALSGFMQEVVSKESRVCAHR